MTLQPLPSEYPYTVYDENYLFFFISVEGRAGDRVSCMKDDGNHEYLTRTACMDRKVS
jgi:hypothetical protein